jgi:hypothetical protein
VRRAAALAALALVAAGCGGGGEDAETGTPVEPVDAVPAPEVGGVLSELVAAAQEGDAPRMWELLSPQTQETLGPTPAEFRHGLAQDLVNGIGTLLRDPEVVVSVRVGAWGVATVVGERIEDGEREDYAYAAAFRRVDGAWRAELGGAAPGALEPPPLETTDATPTVAGRMDASGPLGRAALWLDAGSPRVLRHDDGPFSARLVVDPPPRALAPGVHTVTLFATTPDTAAAAAWPFEVER